MKIFTRIFAVAVMLAAVTLAAVAGDNQAPTYNKDQAEQNLLVGLASGNAGLRQSCAFMLGEIGSTKAVLPLMALLHDGDEGTRIVAALALSRIGDARGTWAVKQAVKFDRSQRVQQLAAWYYTQYVEPGAFEFIATDSNQDVESIAQR